MKKFEKPEFKIATYDTVENYGKFVIEPLERGSTTTVIIMFIVSLKGIKIVFKHRIFDLDKFSKENLTNPFQ